MLLCKEHRPFLLSYEAPQDSMLPPISCARLLGLCNNFKKERSGGPPEQFLVYKPSYRLVVLLFRLAVLSGADQLRLPGYEEGSACVRREGGR